MSSEGKTDADELWKKVPQELLQSEYLEIVQDIPRLGAEAKAHGEFAMHFFHRLNIALENAIACVFLARMGLMIPLVTITRSIFESMIATYWASLSEENLTKIIEAEKQELMRIMRNNLKAGRAVIRNKTTGEIETDTILNNPEVIKAKRPPKFDKMAEAAGIKNIYDMFYGSLSIYAHGHAVNLVIGDLYSDPRDGTDKLTTAILPLMRGCLKAIRLITVNYISENRQTTIEEMEKILGVKLSS